MKFSEWRAAGDLDRISWTNASVYKLYSQSVAFVFGPCNNTHNWESIGGGKWMKGGW